MRSLVSLTALLLASQLAAAQEAPAASAPIRVSIERFTSNTPDLDPLHTVLPNVLQAGLLQFGSLSADVASRAAGEPAVSGGGKSEYQWRLLGRYVRQGQRIRLEVTPENIENAFDLPPETVTFEPAEMLSQMQDLAQRCGRALLRAATNATDVTSVDSEFTDATRGKLTYLSDAIPRAAERAIATAGLGEPDREPSTGGAQRRFQVGGSFQVLTDAVRVRISVADRSGEALSFDVASSDKFGTTLPDTVAGRVVEAVRGMMDQTASSDADCKPPAADAPACLAAGDAARRQRKQNLAIVLYRRAQPAEALAGARLIRIYVEMGQADAAISEARLLASASGNTARTRLSSGLIHLLRSENAEAIREFNQALAMNIEPAWKPFVYLWMADARLAQADGAPKDDDEAAIASDAVADYQRALDGGISDTAAYLSFAHACAIAKQSEKAIDTIKTAYDRDQSNSDLREALASLYRDEGVRLCGLKRYGDAKPWLDKALALNPTEPSVVAEAASRVAWILGFNTDPPQRPEAIEMLERAIKADPKDEWSFWAMARLYRNQARDNRESEDDYNRAVDALKTAVSLGTDYTDYWDLADLYSETNRPDRARDTLQTAVGAGGSPSQIGESYVRLAWVYRALGDMDRALAALDSAANKRPNDEWVVRNKAGILELAARYGEAIQTWREAQRLEATRDAYVGLGDTYRQIKSFSDAETAYRKAKELQTDCSKCDMALARTLALEGKHDEALAALRQALVKPSADSDYESAIIVYGTLKETENARNDLETWLKSYPDSSEVTSAAVFFWHEYTFEYERAYESRRAERQRHPLDLDNLSDLAEASLTSGHYDETLQLADRLLNEQAVSIQQRFVVHTLATAALLAKGDHGKAQLEVGRFISEYRATKSDWERSWYFLGTRHYIEQSRDFAPIERQLLDLMLRALETNRPESDGLVSEVEGLVTSGPFRALADQHAAAANAR